MDADWLHVTVGQQAFLVQHTQISRTAPVALLSSLHDERGQALRQVALASVLGLPPAPVRHALLVLTRRRTVALLVAAIDLFQLPADLVPIILPVPQLIAQAVAHNWISGIVIHDDYPLQLLNIRQIAQDALKQQT